MKYTESPLYNTELQTMSDFLELINYRPSTIDGYLKSIFECCCWMKEMYGISLNNGAVAPIEIGVTALFLCPIIIIKIDIGIVIYYYKYITMRRRFFMGIVKQKNPKTGVVYV